MYVDAIMCLCVEAKVHEFTWKNWIFSEGEGEKSVRNQQVAVFLICNHLVILVQSKVCSYLGISILMYLVRAQKFYLKIENNKHKR
jgi:hypothetical protein